MGDIRIHPDKAIRHWEGMDGNKRETKLLIYHARSFADDIGGAANLNHAEIVLCKRLAELTMLLDTAMTALLMDEPFDTHDYSANLKTFNALYGRHERLVKQLAAKQSKVVNPYD